MTTDTTNMTELNEALSADQGGAYRKQLKARLARMEADLASVVQRGIARDAYEAWQAALAATRTAREVVEGIS